MSGKCTRARATVLPVVLRIMAPVILSDDATPCALRVSRPRALAPCRVGFWVILARTRSQDPRGRVSELYGKVTRRGTKGRLLDEKSATTHAFLDPKIFRDIKQSD